jgi:hypothetical protein
MFIPRTSAVADCDAIGLANNCKIIGRSSQIHPGTLGFIDRYWNLRVKTFVTKQPYPVAFADQYSFPKMTGH